MNKITIFDKTFFGKKIFEKNKQDEEFLIYCLYPISESKYLIIKSIDGKTVFFKVKGFEKICSIISLLKNNDINQIKCCVETDIIGIKKYYKKRYNFIKRLKQYYRENYAKFVLLGQDYKKFIEKGEARVA